MNYSSTICAISTAPGIGGSAVIRLSDPETFAVCEKVFFPANKNTTVSDAKSHTLLFGELRDNKESIDEVILSIFRNPHSFPIS